MNGLVFVGVTLQSLCPTLGDLNRGDFPGMVVAR